MFYNNYCSIDLFWQDFNFHQPICQAVLISHSPAMRSNHYQQFQQQVCREYSHRCKSNRILSVSITMQNFIPILAYSWFFFLSGYRLSHTICNDQLMRLYWAGDVPHIIIQNPKRGHVCSYANKKATYVTHFWFGLMTSGTSTASGWF